MLVLLSAACGGGDATPTTTVAPATTGADGVGDLSTSDLTIGPLPAELADWAPYANRHIDVFGVHVVAFPRVSKRAFIHGAGVLAQYLDNDADGTADDERVVRAMTDERAILVMPYDEEDLESSGILESGLEEEYGAQPLFDVETAPSGGFDGALEEVHHLVFDYGWALVHPDRLGPEGLSHLTTAMDLARGGHFEQVPGTYPADAWYHYDDRTCEYDCMATEYFYWSHTTILGAQGSSDRCADIAEEWEPCTPERLADVDSLVTALLRDPDLALPTVLPDGGYRPRS